ncbi:MAG TPA: NAD(P)/FAD-dependent oxidoreductase [Solirubrobacterales bacterium]|nr:NAD(P)/FAD-dependent oxidoreductase [Solirubrobacterales bacterium]
MPERFDAIVVGGRCAGASLATLLARAGLRICVVDRDAFPSDTPSTHGIQPPGVRVLERLGVADRLLEVSEPIVRGTLIVEDVRVDITGLLEVIGAPMLNVRRSTLDPILLETAAAAGAEVRTRTAVTGLVEAVGRVVGVETPDGELRAPLVVGADGARSTVARLVGAAEYLRTPPGRAFLWSYFEGVEADPHRVWLGSFADLGFLASSTDAGLFMAAVTPSIERREELRRDRTGAYETGLRQLPELGPIVASGRRAAPVRMMSNWHGFFRESAGPGWALVGDAGHFKDPTPGQGIADALRQAVELAPAIEAALGGDRDPDAALREWWAWRDRDAWEMYWFASSMGASGPPRLLEREVMRRIAADPALIANLMRVLSHELPPSQLFSTSLALRTFGSSFAKSPGRRRQLLAELGTIVATEARRGRKQLALRLGHRPWLPHSTRPGATPIRPQ